jgi:hypothetical protein
MTMQTRTGTEYEELATRESNGIRVSLLWNRNDNDVKVAVNDASTESAFELAVGEAAPLGVFNHPFAYAAFRDVPCDPPLGEASPRQVAA